MSAGPIDDYLGVVRSRLPWYVRGRRRLIQELRDHLEEAADAAGARAAMTRDDAEREAVARAGPADAAVAAFRAEAPPRRWTLFALAGVLVLALAAGLLVTRATAPAHRPPPRASARVTLAAWTRTTVPVSGGTAAMRARARRILGGLGRTNIVRVAFGRPRDGFRRFRDVAGPIWLSVTVGSHGLGLRRFIDTGPPLWAAGVFERSYEATQPAGAPALRGTTELVTDGRRTLSFESEAVGSGSGSAQSPAPAVVARTLERAARAGSFRLDAVHLVHAGAGDLAASVVLTAASRRSLARRLGAFMHTTAPLSNRLYGFATTLDDACGNRVFVDGMGFEWANPRWLCPNPFVFGYAMTPAECARLARSEPGCSASA